MLTGALCPVHVTVPIPRFSSCSDFDLKDTGNAHRVHVSASDELTSCVSLQGPIVVVARATGEIPIVDNVSGWLT